MRAVGKGVKNASRNRPQSCNECQEWTLEVETIAPYLHPIVQWEAEAINIIYMLPALNFVLVHLNLGRKNKTRVLGCLIMRLCVCAFGGAGTVITGYCSPLWRKNSGFIAMITFQIPSAGAVCQTTPTELCIINPRQHFPVINNAVRPYEK